jgi:VanZ family protein
MTRRRLTVLLWLALLVWACAILWMSSLRPDELPDTGFLFWDKLNHFGAFVVGGWLAAAALRLSRPDTGSPVVLILAVILLAAFGVLDEALQTVNPGRRPPNRRRRRQSAPELPRVRC